MIITICGSTRFRDEMLQVAEQLTLQDHIVLMPNVFHHADELQLTTEDKIKLDNLHKQKIDMSDGIFVVNVDNYIGESTYGEIDWARRHQKGIWFLVEPPKEEEADAEQDLDTTVVTTPDTDSQGE
jgi:hypothetical protein